jgi:hypothetical protein
MFLPIRSTSGSVQVPRPGHFWLGALGGPTPVDFFSPHNTVYSPGIPTRPLPAQNYSGARHLHFLPTHNTQALWFLAPRPIHVWLGVLGGQTMVFDHPTFYCFSPLQPLALSTLRPRRSGASLGWTAQHAHTGFSCHTTHRNSHSQIKKQTSEHFRKKQTWARRKTEQKYEKQT